MTIEQQIPLHVITFNGYAHTDEDLQKQKTLLMFFDTFEVIENNPVIAVLHRSQTFPDSYGCSHMGILMAGHNQLNWDHPNWSGCQHKLQPFSEEEMLDYIDVEAIYSQLPQEGQQIAALYKRTEGHELAAVSKKSFIPQINKLENPTNWIVLSTAHIYHRFNMALLERILSQVPQPEPIRSPNRAEIVEKSPRLSFVRKPSTDDSFLIHRDIKPENMLFDQRNTVVLSDFGIALLAQNSHFLSTQEVAGTVAYMAPEQFQGKLHSDQYALGVVVYEWLSGALPFHSSFSEMASQHLFVPPPPLRQKVPAISLDAKQVVLTALEKDPLRRFESVQAFAAALEWAYQRESSLQDAPSSEVIPPSESSLPDGRVVVLLPTQLPSPTNVVTPSNQDSFVLHDEMQRLIIKYCWEGLDPDKRQRATQGIKWPFGREIRFLENFLNGIFRTSHLRNPLRFAACYSAWYFWCSLKSVSRKSTNSHVTLDFCTFDYLMLFLGRFQHTGLSMNILNIWPSYAIIGSHFNLLVTQRKDISRCVIDYYEQELANTQDESWQQLCDLVILHHRLSIDLSDGLQFFKKRFQTASWLRKKDLARLLFQETQSYTSSMSLVAQRNNIQLCEARLLRLEESPDDVNVLVQIGKESDPLLELYERGVQSWTRGFRSSGRKNITREQQLYEAALSVYRQLFYHPHFREPLENIMLEKAPPDMLHEETITQLNHTIRHDPINLLLPYKKLEQLAVQSFETEQPQTRTQEDLEQ